MYPNVVTELFVGDILVYRRCVVTQNKGKEKENSYQKLKRSPEERNTET